jgi:hypothetical protein
MLALNDDVDINSSETERYASTYELERLKRLERNRIFLQQIWSKTFESGTDPLKQQNAEARQALGPVELSASVDQKKNSTLSRVRKRVPERDPKCTSTPQKPLRRSERKRFREEDCPVSNGPVELIRSTEDGTNSGNSDSTSRNEILSGVFDELYEIQRYFTEVAPLPADAPEPLRVDGHYRGWVNPEVAARWSIASNAAEAWNSNGGGRFSVRNPLGTTKGTSSTRVTLSAKENARRSLQKNPNAYFYRHNEPGEEQWFGDWSPEELDRFMAVARQYGCGDKWGLFASHIPHRVGYQCSSAYRELILPKGLIFDPNYMMTSSGKAVYVGSQRRATGAGRLESPPVSTEDRSQT